MKLSNLLVPSMKAAVCAASLGLALAPAALADAPLFGVGTATGDAAATEAPASGGLFGVGSAVEQTVLGVDAMIGDWQIVDYMSLEDSESSEYMEAMIADGMTMDLSVFEGGDYTLQIGFAGEVQAVDGNWQEVEEVGDDEVVATFDLQGVDYGATVGGATANVLVLASDEEVLYFERVGGDQPAAASVVEDAGFVRTWELTGIDFDGVGGEVDAVANMLGARALDFLGNLGVEGMLQVSDDGTYLLTVTGGIIDRNLVYQGAWETGGEREARFMNEDANLEWFMAAELHTGKLYLHSSDDVLGGLGYLVFSPAEEAYILDGPGSVVENAGEQVVAALPYNAGTGFEWFINVGDPQVLAVTDIETIDLAEDEAIDGGPLLDVFTLVANEPGTTTVTFEFERGWEEGEPEITIVCLFEVGEDGSIVLVDYDGPADYQEYIEISAQ